MNLFEPGTRAFYTANIFGGLQPSYIEAVVEIVDEPQPLGHRGVRALARRDVYGEPYWPRTGGRDQFWAFPHELHPMGAP